MAGWSSIFCATDKRDGVISAVREWLATNGYTPYDPFDIIPGASYPVTVKLFITPVSATPGGAWVRLILAERADKLAEALADFAPTHLLDIADFAGTPAASPGAAVAGVDVAALPDDVQALAGKIDLKGAGRLANKMLGGLGGKLGASDADAAGARVLLSNAANAAIDWSSGAGAALAAQASALGLPGNWRTPDFTILRDAYAVHKRLERSPKARLYEGDADARDAVPDALRYMPIFAGRLT